MLFDHAKAALGDKFDKPDLRMVADGSKGFKNVFGESESIEDRGFWSQ